MIHRPPPVDDEATTISEAPGSKQPPDETEDNAPGTTAAAEKQQASRGKRRRKRRSPKTQAVFAQQRIRQNGITIYTAFSGRPEGSRGATDRLESHPRTVHEGSCKMVQQPRKDLRDVINDLGKYPRRRLPVHFRTGFRTPWKTRTA